VTFGYDEAIDLDLKSYFDTIDHELLVKLVMRRVRDPRIIRLIRLWLRAGVMHEGVWEESVVGTPQGGVISPLCPTSTFILWISTGNGRWGAPRWSVCR
jgi:retron-type reverse transcriptase